MPLIPSLVVDRLPVYARTLNSLEVQDQDFISSTELGATIGATPAQIRKDLSYFGRFGKQGRGYDVSKLGGELRRILGADRQWPMVLVGVGNLGRAIMAYQGFVSQGFVVMAAFDTKRSIVGKTIGAVRVRAVAELPTFLRAHPVDIGIVAVPANAAQEVVDALCSAGIRAILNYAPVGIRVPVNVQVRNIDPVLALQSMTYSLSQGGFPGGPQQSAKEGTV